MRQIRIPNDDDVHLPVKTTGLRNEGFYILCTGATNIAAGTTVANITYCFSYDF